MDCFAALAMTVLTRFGLFGISDGYDKNRSSFSIRAIFAP